MSRDPGAYLTGVAPVSARVTVPKLSEEIAREVKIAGLPDYCEATEECIVKREIASSELGAPLPLEEGSPADDLLRDELARRKSDVADAVRYLAKCGNRHETLEEVVVTMVPCWSRLKTFCIAAAYALAAVLTGMFVGAMLAPALDSGFLANYLDKKPDLDDGFVAMVLAYLDAGGLVIMMAIFQLMAVFATGGKLKNLKSHLLLLDLVFALAWGLQRIEAKGYAMALSVTLLELVGMAGYTLAVGALCKSLERNGELADKYRPAAAMARAALAARAKAESARALAEKALRPVATTVTDRDFSGRVTELRRTLVAETARSAYRVATSEAIAAATANATLDRFNADFDRQLAARGDVIAKPPSSKV